MGGQRGMVGVAIGVVEVGEEVGGEVGVASGVGDEAMGGAVGVVTWEDILDFFLFLSGTYHNWTYTNYSTA